MGWGIVLALLAPQIGVIGIQWYLVIRCLATTTSVAQVTWLYIGPLLAQAAILPVVVRAAMRLPPPRRHPIVMAALFLAAGTSLVGCLGGGVFALFGLL